MRGPIQRNTVSLNRTGHLWPVLFSETVFLWIGPPFRRIGPFRKPNAPILTKHPEKRYVNVYENVFVCDFGSDTDVQIVRYIPFSLFPPGKANNWRNRQRNALDLFSN